MILRDESADIIGTHRIGTLRVEPAKLVEVFGPPSESDGYKVSGSFTFIDTVTGNVFTIYDYKSTSLYEEGLPSASAFWRAELPAEFSIGGRTNSSKFINWLNKQLGDY